MAFESIGNYVLDGQLEVFGKGNAEQTSELCDVFALSLGALINVGLSSMMSTLPRTKLEDRLFTGGMFDLEEIPAALRRKILVVNCQAAECLG